MSKKPLRIGVIGAGAIASSVHLPIMTRRSDLFHVVSLADFNIEAVNVLADRFSIEHRFESANDLIAAKNIDAVAILNSGSHAEYVINALNAGLDVFCEKPLAYSHDEMNRIEAALKSSGKQLMIGYMKTFDPAVLAAAENISGRPRTVDVLVLHPSGHSQLATTDLSVDIPTTPKSLVDTYKKSGYQLQVDTLGEAAAKAFGNLYTDVILGSVIHEFSVLRSLDVHITEIDFVDRWPVQGQTESIMIHGRTADGVRVTIRWFYLDEYPAYQEEVRWVNENEGHHIIFSSPYILRVPTTYTYTKRHGLDREESTRLSYVASFENELEAFHVLTDTGKQQTDPIQAGREDLVIALQVAAKIAERELIELGGDLAK
jgi:myo-inositol 2-dehydrogenase / D-chiro-inositol 1-dehydrogenase